MEFGVQFFPCVGPEQMSAADYFAESLAVATEAERLGFTHARMVEHYFHRYGGYSPNPLVFLSALSQRTQTMRLVTGAVLPVFNDPLKLAGEIGMVDALCRGRLDVGFARAFLKHEFRRFGISPDESQARFREGIEQIELLLTRENVTHAGRFHRFENVTSLPRPTTRPRPKFYIAATQTPETFEFAGRMGYSLMAIPIAGRIKDLFELYRTSWREAGHPGNGEIMVAFHMLCDEDDSVARAVAKPHVEDYFDALAEVTADWVSEGDAADYRGYRESMSRVRSATMESQIDSGSAWIGSPSSILRQIEKVVATMGPFEHASLQVNFSSVGLERALRSLRLFASEVMPKVGGLASAS